MSLIGTRLHQVKAAYRHKAASGESARNPLMIKQFIVVVPTTIRQRTDAEPVCTSNCCVDARGSITK
jgi:hypothetical protein